MIIKKICIYLSLYFFLPLGLVTGVHLVVFLFGHFLAQLLVEEVNVSILH